MSDPAEVPPGYPSEWEADVVLTDGGLARLRPITPADADRLVAFYDRVSPESKYLRFFAAYPRLSPRDVASRDEALSYCAACSIRTACLTLAMRDKSLVGIWGGTDEVERERLRRGSRLAPVA